MEYKYVGRKLRRVLQLQKICVKEVFLRMLFEFLVVPSLTVDQILFVSIEFNSVHLRRRLLCRRIATYHDALSGHPLVPR